MGLGEFSIFYIYWFLNRLERNSILLIEEPECFVSPRSQKGIINYLAKISCELGIVSIFSTHSPYTLTRIPYTNIRVLIPQGYEGRIYEPRSIQEALVSLGMSPTKSGIIFVEDSLSQRILELLFGHFNDQILREFEVLAVRGSDDDVLKAVNSIPKETRYFRIVGVLDSGMQQFKSKYKSQWPLDFLPGDKAPEQLLIDAAYDVDQQEDLSRLLSRDVTFVRMHLSNLEGYDHHDWMIELYRSLGVDYDDLVRALFDIWLKTGKNRDAAQEFVDSVAGQISELGDHRTQ